MAAGVVAAEAATRDVGCRAVVVVAVPESRRGVVAPLVGHEAGSEAKASHVLVVACSWATVRSAWASPVAVPACAAVAAAAAVS